jgi:hypothetical protein
MERRPERGGYQTGPDPYKFPYTGSVLSQPATGASPGAVFVARAAWRGSVEGCEASGFFFEVRLFLREECKTSKRVSKLEETLTELKHN